MSLADAEKKMSKAAMAREMGIPVSTLKDRIVAEKSGRVSVTKDKPVSIAKFKKIAVAKPKKGNVERFILSSAQDGRPVNAPFLKNLEAYAEHLDAKIIIAPYSYAMGGQNGVYDPAIVPYLSWDQHTLANKIIFAGNIRTNPTSPHPLSGLETYTGDKWGVFPHPRVSLRSIATHFGAPAKQIMTTGTITKPKYRSEKTGTKAMFHSVYGAVLVEIDDAANVFCRHLLVDSKGDFQDLDMTVKGGFMRPGSYVDAITYGDIHIESIDIRVKDATWGEGGMLDTLKPKHQIIHDLADLGARSHHSRGNPHHNFKVYSEGKDKVVEAMADASLFLQDIRRPWCKTVVVESNHDAFLERWLREADYRNDPANAIYFLKLQLRKYQAIHQRNSRFSVFEFAVRERMDGMGIVGKGHPSICPETFLRETDSHKINGIEYGLHGHRGANGAKGSLASFAKGGSKAVVGHTHSPAIHEGIYQVGTSSLMDLEYNRGGLSSWAHTHCLTYSSGKRTLITIQNGKWRASP